MTPGARPHLPARQRGVTLLALLFVMALMGMAYAAAAVLVQTTLKREREAELLFVGAEFQRALASYAAARPGREMPQRLEDLLRDPRFPGVRRHLRKLYADPVTRGQPWGLIRDARGGIMGLHSLSREAPLKRAHFAPRQTAFARARTYADWRFLSGRGATAAGLAATQAIGGSTAGATSDPGAAGPAPGAPGATPGPAAAPVANEQREQACASLLATDLSACVDAERVRGAAQGALCRASAQERNRRCLSDGSWTQLLTRPEFNP